MHFRHMSRPSDMQALQAASLVGVGRSTVNLFYPVATMTATCTTIIGIDFVVIVVIVRGKKAEEEGFYKLQPANKTDHLCQSWQ